MDIVDYSKVEKQLKKLPKHILIEFRVWVQTVETAGIWGAQMTKKYRDHALKGGRKGQRAACLDRSYRIIYDTYEGKKIRIVQVEKVTKHDYRKK